MMPARKRRTPGGLGWPAGPMMALDGARRVGWAKYFTEVELNEHLEHANAVLVDRIETLVPVCLQLVQDVLHERNPQAFATAWKVDQIVRQYCHGARTDGEAR